MTICVFIRHALTRKDNNDKLRPISDDGILQAKECALLLKAEIPFDLAITSSALRAKSTLDVILKQLGQTPKIIELESIYHPENIQDQINVNNMLTLLGKMSLEDYRENDKNNSWARYETKAIVDVVKILKKYRPKRILIVGHGNIINAIGLSFAPMVKQLKEVYFNYCEGFEVSDGKLVRLVTNTNDRSINKN